MWRWKRNNKNNINQVIKKLTNKNIGTRPFFWPMHKQDAFKKKNYFKKISLPNSEFIAKNGFYLPSGLGLTIKELKFVKKNKNFIEVGAGVSLYDFQNIIKSHYLDFYNILKRYGSVQIRNVGTISGNIATASPIGDTLPLLLSLDAVIKIQTKNKTPLLSCLPPAVRMG